MLRRVTIKASDPWTFIETHNGSWIGRNEALRMTLHAETREDLAEDAGLLTDMVLRDELHDGDLPKFLQEHGLTTEGPVPSPGENVVFDVLFPAPIVRWAGIGEGVE